MSLTSLTSRNNSNDDFKAAFICVNNGPNGHFISPEEFTRALQGCGKNPSKKKIENYWNFYKRIGIEEFCEIAQQEETINEKQILDAFRAIDLNKDGFIGAKELINIFTSNKDGMNVYEAEKILHESGINKNDRINYEKFAKIVVDTVEEAKNVARKKMKKICNV